MTPATVFVTYNPGNDFEQTLAVRLHTIGAVHGFNMLMPDRFNEGGALTSETLYRIRRSDYFILFSTSLLTPVVQQEVNEAFAHLQDKSKILIIYNRVKNLQHNENCTEVTIDTRTDSVQQILDTIIQQIKQSQGTPQHAISPKDDTVKILGGILLIGLGFLALDSLFSPTKKK